MILGGVIVILIIGIILYLLYKLVKRRGNPETLTTTENLDVDHRPRLRLTTIMATLVVGVISVTFIWIQFYYFTTSSAGNSNSQEEDASDVSHQVYKSVTIEGGQVQMIKMAWGKYFFAEPNLDDEYLIYTGVKGNTSTTQQKYTLNELPEGEDGYPFIEIKNLHPSKAITVKYRFGTKDSHNQLSN